MAVNAAVSLERPADQGARQVPASTMLAEEVALGRWRSLIRWHIKSTTKAQQGLYEYDAVSRLRDSQLGTMAHDIANYIKKGKLWEAFESEEQVVPADRRRWTRPISVLTRPAGRTGSHANSLVYETGQTIKAEHRPIIIITSNNEKELPTPSCVAVSSISSILPTGIPCAKSSRCIVILTSPGNWYGRPWRYFSMCVPFRG